MSQSSINFNPKYLLYIGLVILLVSSSTITPAAHAGDMTEDMELSSQRQSHYYDMEDIDIGVVYDPYNEITNTTAHSLNYSLGLMTPDVELYPVSDLEEIDMTLKKMGLDIVLYSFQSEFDGVILSDENDKTKHDWQDFVNTIDSYKDVEQIFAMGNSKQILAQTNNATNFHGSYEEKVDAKHMFIYGMWTTAQVLETNFNSASAQYLAQDIKKTSAKFLTENFNDIVARNMNKVDSLGTEHPSTIEKRRQDFMDKHPANASRISRDGYVADNELMRDVDPETGKIADDYIMDIIPADSITPSDFILQKLPISSGLRGPIGGIVDALLKFLIDQFSAAIGLSEDVVQNIVNTLLQIPKLIGDLQNKGGSALKSFLDNLKNQLPIPQDLMKYYDLIVDGLFLLRGSFDDIKNFVLETIDMVLPDLSIGGISLTDLLSQLLDIGQNVKNQVEQGGQDLISIVFSTLNQLISQNLTQTLLNSVDSEISATTQQLTSIATQIMSLANMTINMVSSGDVTGLIETFGPLLLDAIGISSTGVIGPIMKVISIVMTSLEFVSGLNLQELIVDLLDDLLTAQQEKLISMASQIITLITDVIEGSVAAADVQAKIDSILSEFSVAQEIREGISYMVYLVVKIRNNDFDLTSLVPTVNIKQMIVKVLTGLGVVASDTIENVVTTAQFIIGQVKFYADLPIIDSLINSTISSLNSFQDLLYRTVDLFFQNVLGLNESFKSAFPTADKILTSAISALSLIIEAIGAVGDNSMQGLMLTLLNSASYILTQVTEIDIQGYVEIAKSLVGDIFDLVEDPPSLNELLTIVLDYIPTSAVKDKVERVIKFIFDIKDVFSNGYEFVFSKLTEWLGGKVRDLISSLSGDIGDILGQENWDLLDINLPIGIGSFSLFSIDIKLGLQPNFEFNYDKFSKAIFDMVLRGKSLFTDAMNVGEVLRESLSFLSIVPTLTAEMALNGFGSDNNPFLKFMLEALGVELSVSGSGNFALSLLSFTNGVFNTESFMKILEWGFTFTVELSRTFTLLDFLTGGAAGGLSSIAQYIGLDAITLTIALALTIDLIKRAATANKPETGSLTITVEISFTVAIALDIVIAALKLAGTLAITLTLVQDLVTPTPMRVFIAIQLILDVTIEFFGFDVDIEVKWSPSGYEPDPGYELTPSSQSEAKDQGALGGDLDGDGLSDQYEADTPGLNPNLTDSDGDGLSDKFESQTLGTDPSKKDTDGDGLADNVEQNLKTDPLNPDTDGDGLDDYKETNIYGTDPLALDTDEDGLTDKYEINHAWNNTGVTTSVKEVVIGGVSYDDRTDPLNPDTDGDGLLDGQEGPMGTYYGPHLFDVESTEYTPDEPLIFNGGYTHPLDNDTDDDSYLQLYDGSIAPMEENYLMDMTDGREVKGIDVMVPDPDTGELVPKTIRTNPVNPDSDGDTGVTSEQRDDPPRGEFLNSDGYELSIDPPSDPLDGDSDDDGLIDGLEGVLRSDSNHTDVNNPDTDGDGLPDMLETEYGTDPRSPDTDLDGVTDGDEYFIYGTSPFMADTDNDGLNDGQELYIYHTNPFLQDSDTDGLDDYREVFETFSDPVDDDSDNDGLTDYEEIVVHYTDPFEPDTDGDGIFDGEEVEGITLTSSNGTNYTVRTDPTKWDTDGDSLKQEDQNGEMSMSMSDGDEVLKYGTDPTLADTDSDNIKDGWEIYLGEGKIPHIEPMELDPLSNDTDGDGLTDGKELTIANRSTLLYPYVGFYLITPLNTSAVDFDTDGDGLNDSIEIQLNTSPQSNDTDGDNITDYTEYTVYGTSPIKNDTDGDNLLDNEEINGYQFPRNQTLSPDQTTILTDPLNSDSDGDLLPDGLEVDFYNTDPRISDVNNNGILDGMEIDTDGDQLYDGEEFYIYNTVASPYGGGIQDPDSDDDGLFDGQEVFVTSSDPNHWDSDNDTFSDGLEYHCQTGILDPNTTKSDFNSCFDIGRLAILSPVAKTYNTNAIPVIAYDGNGNVVSMEYRHKKADQSNWSPTVTMTEQTNRSNYWQGSTITLPPETGNYVLELTAVKNDSTTVTRQVKFKIDIGNDTISITQPEDGEYNFQEWQDPKLPIKVKTNLNVNSTWFKINFDNGTLLEDNTTLSYESGLNAYYLPEYQFPDIQGSTNYTLTVYAKKTNGQIILDTVSFTIKTPTTLQTALKAGGLVGGIAVISGVLRVAAKRGIIRNPFSKN